MPKKQKAKKLLIEGVVQGVGFRPFVYTLAKSLAIVGWVRNDGNGVQIHIQGDATSLDTFVLRLKADKPSLAVINSIKTTRAKLADLHDFEILQSTDTKHSSAFIPPDITICAECEMELKDPANRRYGYALTNCAHCGPRHTIIESLPYDRAATSMKLFAMCAECKKEYEDPANRRFHAQPISCPQCGPRLSLKDANGLDIHGADIIQKSTNLIKQGKILAIKGLGGFHLVCDASNESAVVILRGRKRRPSKPLAVMFGSLEMIKNECKITKSEVAMLTSQNRPITLLKKSKSFCLAPSLSSQSAFLGCFLPYTPLQTLLLSHLDSPIVATSANISDEPIITDEAELYARLGGVFDFCLDFDRPIINGCDDSVARMSGTHPVYLRLARGYAPMSLKTKWTFKEPIIALGAQQKSTVAIGIKDSIIQSAHIGDLFSVPSIDAYKKVIQNMQNLYGFEPKMLVCDQNPAYASSVYANESGTPFHTIQHHKAHFLAGLYEANLLESPALGIVFDGTGLGDDGHVRGGEFFTYDGSNIKRVCHLKESLMLGGEMSAKEPRRSGLARLFEIYGESALGLDNPTIKSFKEYELKALFKMWQSSSNSLPSSSAGRLFDAVASFAGLVQTSGYEGEAGLLMESLYMPSVKNRYEINIGEDIDFSQIFKDNSSKPAVKISMFFNTLSFAIGEVASRYSLPVVLSGGVFQNAVLCQLVRAELQKRGLKSHFHKRLSPNDSSISIGQAVYAQGVQNSIFAW